MVSIQKNKTLSTIHFDCIAIPFWLSTRRRSVSSTPDCFGGPGSWFKYKEIWRGYLAGPYVFVNTFQGNLWANLSLQNAPRKYASCGDSKLFPRRCVTSCVRL